jgi:hypothetical protein
MSVMGSIAKNTRTEVTEKLRREVNRIVQGYVDQGVAEVVPGVVFIDEVSAFRIFLFYLFDTFFLQGTYVGYRVFHILERVTRITYGTYRHTRH